MLFATAKLYAALKLQNHVAVLRYYSTDPAIAQVSETGVITAKAKGSCVIRVVAHTGVSKTIKVTVK